MYKSFADAELLKKDKEIATLKKQLAEANKTIADMREACFEFVKGFGSKPRWVCRECHAWKTECDKGTAYGHAPKCRIGKALANNPKPEQPRLLARNQPCGCVVCICEDEDQCQGCGGKNCGTHGNSEIPNPVYEPKPETEGEL